MKTKSNTSRWPVWILMIFFGCIIMYEIGSGSTKCEEPIVELIYIVLYFLPTFVAYSKGKKNRSAIAVLNLLTGWTVIGWVIALVWACCND